MLKTIFIALLSLLVLLGIFFSSGSNPSLAGGNKKGQENNTGTLEKMIVANGSVAMDVNLSRFSKTRTSTKNTAPSTLRFEAERDSFFTMLVFNNELRGPLPSAMTLVPQNYVALPAKLSASYGQLVVENMPFGEPYDLTVRDGKTG